jgi:hypothetical protein
MWVRDGSDMNRYWQRICVACALTLGLSSALAEDINGPRTLPVNEGLMTIYPLQVEGMEGNTVHYRAALAYRNTVDAEPVFGAGWFESEVKIDRENRVVHSGGLRVRQTRFPEGTDDVQDALTAALAAQSPSWNLDRSLDDLEAALQIAAAEQESLQNLNNAPPRIVYRDHPALLVTLDGEPLLREIENSSYQAVINTPYPLISDGRHFYLNVTRDVWYRADRATGPYRFETSPPEGIAAMVKLDQEAVSVEAPAEPVTAANAPEIVVATQPTELIVTEGPAVFVPLVDDLLVLQNSDDDVFMHVETQQFYVVLAGRWYHAGSLNGPWAYQAADQLPAAFADIPRSSGQADARVHVAGTAEAEEALLDAQLPQTAAVARGTADVEVSYDGEPDFRPVDGTDLEYAANTGATVLQSDRRYYLVEDGVWYVSDRPNGPWQVSAWRPQAVARIAPTSPVYHVKYVYIYDSTPDVVYVGYTPGYLGSYVHRGTVVYGTGWYYRPWVSPYYYYPRPSTWGFHVSYNPWSGWGFGLSWNWGWGWDPFYSSYWAGGYWHRPYSWHHRHYGYWGPRGYRPRPAPYGHHRGGHDRYVQPHQGAGGSRYRGRHDNLYRDPGQRARVADTRDVYRRLQPGREGGEARGRNRHERVTPADLRRKARIRDVKQSAVSSMMAAENLGKVSRKSSRQPLPHSQAAPARSVSAAKQLQTRKQPVQQAVPPADMHRVARQARGQAIRWPVKPATETPSRPPQAAASRRQDLRQTAQPATGAGGSTQNRSPAVDRAKMSAASKPVYRVQPAPARTRTVPQQSQRASTHPQLQKSARRPPVAAPAQAPQHRAVSALRERPSVSESMPKSAGRPDRGPSLGPNRERNRENQRRQ